MQIKNYKHLERGYLIGEFTISLSNGFDIHQCLYFEKGTRKWFSFPVRKYQSKDGENRYAPYVTVSKDQEDNLQKVVLGKLQEFLPAKPKDDPSPAKQSNATPQANSFSDMQDDSIPF
jgi:hypothetical protein